MIDVSNLQRSSDHRYKRNLENYTERV